MFHVPETQRVQTGRMASCAADGNNGLFLLQKPGDAGRLQCLASDKDGWEHVSALHRLRGQCRAPTWQEMCWLKTVFWDADDAVMQLHPPQHAWVEKYGYVLHLWRPSTAPLPVPSGALAGFLSSGTPLR